MGRSAKYRVVYPLLTFVSVAAHSLLLERGLIRVGINMPVKPQFTIAVVHDPYGCAITNDPKTGLPVVSVYRRPLPTSNLRYQQEQTAVRSR